MHLDAALRDLRHPDARVRARAADALGRVLAADRAAALAALLPAVDDPHPSVRYAAILSLGELGAGEATEAVALRLDDGEPLVREAAAIALGDIGAALVEAAEPVEAAWAALAEATRTGAPEVRFQAIASLAQISSERAVPLVRPLLDDGDAKVRAQAAAALGDARDAASAEALAARLTDVPEVRHEAALALARLGDGRGREPLVEALAHAERALDAASALATLGVGDDLQALATLRRLVGRLFADPLVKVRAAEALARAGDPRGREHLEKARRARREDVRGLAQSVLSDLDADR